MKTLRLSGPELDLLIEIAEGHRAERGLAHLVDGASLPEKEELEDLDSLVKILTDAKEAE